MKSSKSLLSRCKVNHDFTDDQDVPQNRHPNNELSHRMARNTQRHSAAMRNANESREATDISAELRLRIPAEVENVEMGPVTRPPPLPSLYPFVYHLLRTLDHTYIASTSRRYSSFIPPSCLYPRTALALYIFAPPDFLCDCVPSNREASCF
jgi:hypothetical protein